ncbi:YdcF family protein [Fructobacillus durionis]|uniref:Uncharacterized SAM-binding protein YcdF, DUF218 family n=1 Tax=Fructobacillus durionis TaxID=283737 RepID=A0A1I1GI81_9LACO|nr:YdcF family protein [Fructobacillus durionis]SFC11135.1 Uncharacterized SAM-binding protein YcdF, DUF218 family [Fructobacillus durionis]
MAFTHEWGDDVALFILLLLTTILVLALAWLSWGIWWRLRMRPMMLLLTIFLLILLIMAWSGMAFSMKNVILKSLWQGAFAILILLDAGWCLTLFAMKGYEYRHRKVPQVQDMIVLGAYLKDGHEVGPILAGRINRAMDLAIQQGSQATVIFTGGQGFDEQLPEGVAMKAYAERTFDYPEKQLLVESSSRNTFQNLTFSKEKLHDLNQTILIATSDYHVLRASFLARRVGLSAQVIGAKTTIRVRWRGRLREYLALINLQQGAVLILIALIFGIIFLMNFFL